MWRHFHPMKCLFFGFHIEKHVCYADFKDWNDLLKVCIQNAELKITGDHLCGGEIFRIFSANLAENILKNLSSTEMIASYFKLWKWCFAMWIGT